MGYFRDHKGHRSVLRVMAFGAFTVACFMAVWNTVAGTPADTGLIGLFLGSAFTGKVGQKYVELKNDENTQG